MQPDTARRMGYDSPRIAPKIHVQCNAGTSPRTHDEDRVRSSMVSTNGRHVAIAGLSQRLSGEGHHERRLEPLSLCGAVGRGRVSLCYSGGSRREVLHERAEFFLRGHVSAIVLDEEAVTTGKRGKLSERETVLFDVI